LTERYGFFGCNYFTTGTSSDNSFWSTASIDLLDCFWLLEHALEQGRDIGELSHDNAFLQALIETILDLVVIAKTCH